MVCNLLAKSRSSHLIQGVMWWELKLCWRMWAERKIVPKHELLESIPLHIQELKCEKRLWVKRSCWGRETKLPFVYKRTFLASFPNHMLKNIWVEPMFPFVLLPYYEKVKWDTIGVARETSAKLPHHKGHVPAYFPWKTKCHLYITL